MKSTLTAPRVSLARKDCTTRTPTQKNQARKHSLYNLCRQRRSELFSCNARTEFLSYLLICCLIDLLIYLIYPKFPLQAGKKYVAECIVWKLALYVYWILLVCIILAILGPKHRCMQQVSKLCPLYFVPKTT